MDSGGSLDARSTLSASRAMATLVCILPRSPDSPTADMLSLAMRLDRALLHITRCHDPFSIHHSRASVAKGCGRVGVVKRGSTLALTGPFAMTSWPVLLWSLAPLGPPMRPPHCSAGIRPILVMVSFDRNTADPRCLGASSEHSILSGLDWMLTSDAPKFDPSLRVCQMCFKVPNGLT